MRLSHHSFVLNIDCIIGCGSNWTGADFDPKIESVDDALDGGESKTYVFQIPEDQDPGLMWYHNHFHGTTAHAYLSGLYGLMVIEGTAQDVAQAPGIKDATEVFLIIGEFFNIPDTTKPYPELPLAYSFDWISLTNGHDGATTKFQFEAGEVVLFRAASATVEPTIRISIDGHKMISVAYEGFSVPALKEVDTLDIGGGQRVEFLVRFDAPGTFVMRRARWATGLNITGPASCGLFFGSPTERCLNYDVARTIGTIEILPSDTAEASMEPLIDSIELPGINAYHQELAVRAPVANKTINFQFETTFPLFQIPYDGPFVPPGFGFGINDVLYTPFHSLGTVQTGTCETWEIISVPLPGVEHPFHIHQADFMVTHEDGVLLEKPVWRDTVIIYGKSVTIHVCFDRAMPGDRLPIHCHMASHQDIGGIGMYDVIGRVFSSPDTSVEIAMDTLVPAAPAAKPTLAPAAPIPKPVSSPPMPTVTSAPLTVQPVVPISKTSGEKMKKKKSKKMMQKISSDSSSSSFSSSSSEDGGSLRGAN